MGTTHQELLTAMTMQMMAGLAFKQLRALAVKLYCLTKPAVAATCQLQL
jgi:hypothetical protein